MDLPTSFPPDAFDWLIGNSARTVLCLGGPEIAAAAAEAGHDVALVADPDRTPPLNERSVDVVIAAGRLPQDLEAIARLLRPGGHLALVTRGRDHRIPWARKLDAALGATVPAEHADALVASAHFGFVDEHEFRYWETVNRDTLAERLRGERHPEDRITAGLELYDDYGRGHDGMQLPWVARGFKATVLEDFWGSPMNQDDTGEFAALAAETGEFGAVPTRTEKVQVDDGSMLLIDFH